MTDPGKGTNRALSLLFGSMADLLAMQQANPYRVRAYRRAAESLSSLDEPVETISARGALKDIPGVGKELANKIEEFMATGTIQDYEALKKPLPDAVASWATLPGLSAPLVHYLYHRLGIRTLADLEALVRSHMLQTLPGVEVSEAALLSALHERQERLIAGAQTAEEQKVDEAGGAGPAVEDC